MSNDREDLMNGRKRPLVLIDFDGVINQFPDEKVRRRQNTTSWMEQGDPRIALYSPDNWFIPDHKEMVTTQYHGRLRLLWAAGLVDRLKTLDADILWLSTWQPYTDMLNVHLGIDWETIQWYDPVTRVGRYTGKRRAVLNHLKYGRPIVWIDDEETTYDAGLAITAQEPQAPVLAVGPESHIGINRAQMALIERFVAAPPQEPEVRFEVCGNDHEEHWGF